MLCKTVNVQLQGQVLKLQNARRNDKDNTDFFGTLFPVVYQL